MCPMHATQCPISNTLFCQVVCYVRKFQQLISLCSMTLFRLSTRTLVNILKSYHFKNDQKFTFYQFFTYPKCCIAAAAFFSSIFVLMLKYSKWKKSPKMCFFLLEISDFSTMYLGQNECHSKYLEGSFIDTKLFRVSIAEMSTLFTEFLAAYASHSIS